MPWRSGTSCSELLVFVEMWRKYGNQEGFRLYCEIFRGLNSCKQGGCPPPNTHDHGCVDMTIYSAYICSSSQQQYTKVSNVTLFHLFFDKDPAYSNQSLPDPSVADDTAKALFEYRLLRARFRLDPRCSNATRSGPLTHTSYMPSSRIAQPPFLVMFYDR